jgi:hypothetical protein
MPRHNFLNLQTRPWRRSFRSRAVWSQTGRATRCYAVTVAMLEVDRNRGGGIGPFRGHVAWCSLGRKMYSQTTVGIIYTEVSCWRRGYSKRPKTTCEGRLDWDLKHSKHHRTLGDAHAHLDPHCQVGRVPTRGSALRLEAAITLRPKVNSDCRSMLPFLF